MLALHENALIAALKARPGLANTLRAVGAIPQVPSDKLLARYAADAPAIYVTTLTFCVLVLRNGFTVVGKSAPASPANFDAEIGMKIARADAVNQVWPLMGYALRDRLQQAAAASSGS